MTRPDCADRFAKILSLPVDDLPADLLAHLTDCPDCAARFEREVADPLAALLAASPLDPPAPAFPRARLRAAAGATAAPAAHPFARLIEPLRRLLAPHPVLAPAFALLLLLALAAPWMRVPPQGEPRDPAVAAQFDALLPPAEIAWIDRLTPNGAEPLPAPVALAPPLEPLARPADKVAALAWPDTLVPGWEDEEIVSL